MRNQVPAKSPYQHTLRCRPPLAKGDCDASWNSHAVNSHPSALPISIISSNSKRDSNSGPVSSVPHQCLIYISHVFPRFLTLSCGHANWLLLQVIGHGSMEHQFIPWWFGASGGQWHAVSCWVDVVSKRAFKEVANSVFLLVGAMTRINDNRG